MGNIKNFKGSHACRGKYSKKYAPYVPIKKRSSHKVNHDSNRIINLTNLKEHLQVVSQHAATCQQCTNKALSGYQAITLIGEQNRQGLCSVLTSRCTGCRIEFKFSTSSRVKGMSGGRYWECNLAAVWGQMAIGGGHAPLTVNGCAWRTFFDKKVLHVHRKTDW